MFHLLLSYYGFFRLFLLIRLFTHLSLLLGFGIRLFFKNFVDFYLTPYKIALCASLISQLPPKSPFNQSFDQETIITRTNPCLKFPITLQNKATLLVSFCKIHIDVVGGMYLKNELTIAVHLVLINRIDVICMAKLPFSLHLLMIVAIFGIVDWQGCWSLLFLAPLSNLHFGNNEFPLPLVNL